MAKTNQKDIVKLESNKYRNRLEKEGKLKEWDKFVASNPDVKGGELVKAFNTREVQPVAPPPPIAPTPAVSPYKTSGFGMPAPVSGTRLPTSVVSPTYSTNVKAQYTTPQPPITPEGEPIEWDYKTAKVSPSGEVLPSNAVSFKPDGKPYFGPGLGGKLKEYTYNLVGKAPDMATAEDFKAIDDLGKQQETLRQQSNKQAMAGDWAGVFETLKKSGGLALSEVVKGVEVAASYSDYFEKPDAEGTTKMFLPAAKLTGTKTAVSSPITPVLRLTKVGVQAVGDLFTEAAVLVEKGLSATMPVYEPGPRMADTMAARAKAMGDVFKEIPKPVQIPTTIGERWDAGGILYSSLLDPSLREDFIKRARAGEEPELLAMEMQNPWAEMVGQLVLDPLNIVGFLGKSAKVGKIIDKASDEIKVASEAADHMGDALKLAESEPARAAEFLAERTKMVEAVETGKLTQSFKPSALSIAGNVARTRSQTISFLHQGISSLMARGSTTDDIVDWIRAGVLSTSKNTDEMSRGLTHLLNMPEARLMFTEQGTETFTLIRKMMQDENGIIDADKFITKLTKGTTQDELIKIATNMMEDAAKKNFPTMTQMQNAAKKVAFGKEVSPEIKALSDAYNNMDAGTRRAYTLAEKYTENVKNPINKVLGTFYFNSYGYGVRNAENNFITAFADERSLLYFQDGKFWTGGAIDDYLIKRFGELPVEASGFVSQVESQGLDVAKTGLRRFTPKNVAANAEKSMAKRIFWSRYKEAEDLMLRPGKALPTLEQFKANGFTENQVKHFIRRLKDNGLNVDKTIAEFLPEGGKKNLWTMWETYVDPDDLKGFKEVGFDDALGGLKPNATKDEIKAFFAESITEQKKRASMATEAMPMKHPIAAVDNEIQTYMSAAEKGNLPADVAQRQAYISTQRYNAQKKYTGTVFDAYSKVPQTDPNYAPINNMMKDFLASTNDRAMGVAASVAHGRNAKVQELVARIDKGDFNYEKLWAELTDSALPKVTDKKGFINELYNFAASSNDATWTGYHNGVFDKSRELVKVLAPYDPTIIEKATQAEREVEKLNLLQVADFKSGKPKFAVGLEGKNLSQIHIPSLKEKGWDRGVKGLLNAVNKDRRAAGLPEYAKAADVPLAEATEVLNKRLSAAKEVAKAPVAEARKYAPITKEQEQKLRTLLYTGDPSIRADQLQKGVVKKTGGWDVTFPDGKKARIAPMMFMSDEVSYQIIGTKEKGYVTWDVLNNSELKNITTGEIVQKAKAPIAEAGQEVAQAASKVGDIKAEELVAEGAGDITLAPAFIQEGGGIPTLGHAMNENSAGLVKAMEKLRDQMLQRYGMLSPDDFSPSKANALATLTKDLQGRTAEIKNIATKTGKYWRDFALLPYGETKNLDLAMSAIYPYQFWYSRTYANWMKRVATDPQVIANYFRLKQTMAETHRDAPEWFKYNTTVPDFLGINYGNPMIFNLEAGLNPLYGITGEDFNDSYKRTNWFTATIDDIGKFGPSVWAPIQLGIATAYSIMGEKEIASRWAGRLIPQTSTIKAIASRFGKNLELDPVVQIFNGKKPFDFGAADTYEQGRIARALTSLEDKYGEEAVIEAARTHSGPIWDEAQINANKIRSAGQISSFLFGQGFKGRTPEDIQIDKMNTQIAYMYKLMDADMISPEQTKAEWERMRTEFPEMDIYLLSRKNDKMRDTAYAYNVLGRIPPGDTAALLDSYGMDYAKVQKFYDNKGFTGMSAGEKEQFMGVLVQLGAELKLPDGATRQEWNQAKDVNAEIRKQIEAEFGPAIWGTMDKAFELSGDAQSAWYDSHPEIDEANQMKYEALVNNPTAFKYYGSMDTIRSYVEGQRRQEIDKRFGEGYTEKIFQYWDMKKTDPTAAKQYFTEEKLGTNYNKFNDFYFGTDEQVNKFVADLAEKLPEGPETVGQEGERINIPREEVLAKIDSEMTPALKNLVRDYFNGKDLSDYAKLQLEKMANRNNLTQSELLDYLAMMQ